MSELTFSFSDINNALKENQQSETNLLPISGVSEEIIANSTAMVILPKDQLTGFLDSGKYAGVRLYFDYDSEEEEGSVFILGLDDSGSAMIGENDKVLVSSREHENVLEVILPEEKSVTDDVKAHLETIAKLEMNYTPEVGFKVSYSKTEIMNLAKEGEIIRVSIVRLPYIDTEKGSFRSTAISVSSEDRPFPPTSLVNLLPCPPNCGGDYPPQK